MRYLTPCNRYDLHDNPNAEHNLLKNYILFLFVDPKIPIEGGQPMTFTSIVSTILPFGMQTSSGDMIGACSSPSCAFSSQIKFLLTFPLITLLFLSYDPTSIFYIHLTLNSRTAHRQHSPNRLEFENSSVVVARFQTIKY